MLAVPAREESRPPGGSSRRRRLSRKTSKQTDDLKTRYGMKRRETDQEEGAGERRKREGRNRNRRTTVNPKKTAGQKDKLKQKWRTDQEGG
jgi:hypothetical protein